MSLKNKKTPVKNSFQTEAIRLDHVIRKTRELKEISGADLCRRAGDLDPKTLTAVEKGRIKNPSIQTLMSISRGLGVSVSDLFKEAELDSQSNFYKGTQKGAFQIDFQKTGVKIISFTPFIREFFCGKLVLAGKKKFDETLLKHSAHFYLSMIIGRIQVNLEDREVEISEGENIMLSGAFKHQVINKLHREAVMMLMTAPSFLGKKSI